MTFTTQTQLHKATFQKNFFQNFFKSLPSFTFQSKTNATPRASCKTIKREKEEEKKCKSSSDSRAGQ